MSSSHDGSSDPAEVESSHDAAGYAEEPTWEQSAPHIHRHHSGPPAGIYNSYGPGAYARPPSGHVYPQFSNHARPVEGYSYTASPFHRQSSDPQTFARPPSRSNSSSTTSHDSLPYGGAYSAPYPAVSSIPPPGQAGRTRWAWVQMEVPETHIQDELSQYANYPNTYFPQQAPLSYQQYSEHPAQGPYTMHPAGQYNPYGSPHHPGHYPPPPVRTMMPTRPSWQTSVSSASSSSHQVRRHPSSTNTAGSGPRRSGTGNSNASSSLSSPRRGGTILPPKPTASSGSNPPRDILEKASKPEIASPIDFESRTTSESAFEDNHETTSASIGGSSVEVTETIPGRGLRPNYHPQQGPRSDFVMWCGNVPQNATVEELWEVFSRLGLADNTTAQEGTPASEESEIDHGVLSIFLIARSNCAFVNYASAAHLDTAVSYFHGRQVRPQDPRCPKLVCRIRKKDDEAQAGVAGQRNRGMHVAWLKEQKLAGFHSVSPALTATPTTALLVETPSTEGEPPSPALTTASKDTQTGMLSTATAGSYSSSGSTSYASTNSSLFRHPAFRHRFFILKSLRRDDLDRSIETGYWSTQPHNESVLDQAYRNSECVYLIFGVNQTGEFHGYAKMAGVINTPTEPKKEERRNTTSLLTNASGTVPPVTIVEDESESTEESKEHPKLGKADIDAAQALFPASTIDDGLAASQLPMTSPLPISPLPPTGAEVRREDTSTPRFSVSKGASGVQSSSWPHPSLKATDTPSAHSNEDQRRSEPPPSPGASQEPDAQGVVRRDMEAEVPATTNSAVNPSDSASWTSADARLAEQIALRAVIHNLRLDERESRGKAAVLQNQLRSASNETDATVTSASSPDVATDPSQPTAPPRHSSSDSWGKPFRVDWIRTDSLPFHRVKKLRNPWRDNRQIKVSRDGTELEPGVGQLLLQEWNREDPVAVSTPHTSTPLQPGPHSDEDE